MNVVAIPEEAESLLYYLFVTSLPKARTMHALRNLCPGDPAVDRAIAWLIDGGYVYADGESFELTFSGVESAQEIQAQEQSRTFSPTSPRRDSGTSATIPLVDTHPLRTRPQPRHRYDLHYMLAFESPANALPIPVLDGDIAGRLSDANISLPHDEFISGHHCRFSIQARDGKLTLCVEDLGSRNGTYVDGTPLKQGEVVALEHGSRIELGHTLLIAVQIPY